MSRPMTFHQLYEAESSTYTYLLADPDTKEAVLIDSVLETVERDLKLIEEYGYKLTYILDTHVHADHITGAGLIRERTGAKTAVSVDAGVGCAEVLLQDGEELSFGQFKLKALATPGHTNGCMSFYCEGKIFTGDALLIRGTGRTDFQQGSSEKLYESITKKLFQLPDGTQVYPGHDYRGQTSSSIEMEKKFNPRVGSGKTKDQFVQIMSELKLANPKKIHEAVPANLACGKLAATNTHSSSMEIPVVSPQEVNSLRGQVSIVDVRREDEFHGELGHIQGANQVCLGEELEKYLTKIDRNCDVIFVCRSGARSSQATELSLKMGFTKTKNMSGGMILWNQLGLPAVRN